VFTKDMEKALDNEGIGEESRGMAVSNARSEKRRGVRRGW